MNSGFFAHFVTTKVASTTTKTWQRCSTMITEVLSSYSTSGCTHDVSWRYFNNSTTIFLGVLYPQMYMNFWQWVHESEKNWTTDVQNSVQQTSSIVNFLALFFYQTSGCIISSIWSIVNFLALFFYQTSGCIISSIWSTTQTEIITPNFQLLHF